MWCVRPAELLQLSIPEVKQGEDTHTLTKLQVVPLSLAW
jgi:hypothetical protein